MFLKSRFNVIAVSALIASITLVAYLPALSNDFVDWDDADYVTKNPFIHGINKQFISWMFTTFHAGNWHPLTWLSHAVDYAVWGLNPMGHHLTSVLLHGLNTFVVVVLMTRLIGLRQGRSSIVNREPCLPAGRSSLGSPLLAGAVTGVLFGVHPLHVESVAWVSERKDVLYAFFYLMSIWWYVRYAGAPVGRRAKEYGVCLVLFVLSLLSKPMAVTLPLVLLILDVYPLGRFTREQRRPGQGFRANFTPEHRRILVEKVPFILLSAVSSVLTVMAQSTGGAVKSLDLYSFSDRLLISLRTIAFYLYKMIWPGDLVPYYFLPERISFIATEFAASIAAVCFILLLCTLTWKRERSFSAAWMYYIVTLLPVIGIIKAGWQAAADRYTYLPSIGPFMLAGLGAARMWSLTLKKQGALQLKNGVLIVILAAVLISLLITTRQQTGIWKNSEALWTAVIRAFPDNPHALVARGRVYYTQGNIRKALEYYNRALLIDQGLEKGYAERGLAMLILGDYHKAISDFNASLALEPENKEVLVNRSLAYQSLIKKYTNVIQKDPGNVEALINRGGSFAMTGQFDRALEDFNRLIALRPELSITYYNRGLVFKALGSIDLANQDFQRAASLGDPEARAYLESEGIDK
jgi:tetratricopeptide (TPR) repeat protein